jgi:ribonucleoside-diphosphate reductase alpha chain
MLDTKGLRIFFDRYAVKASDEADVGSMVVFTKPGGNGVSSREVGRVLEKENGHVTVGMLDIRENEVLAASDDPDPVTVPSTHADKLEETTTLRMFKRVAGAAAAVEAEENQEKWFKEFTNIMQDWDFVPGGRVLSGLGTVGINTAYNCFVLPAPHDSRKGINDTLYTMTEIMCRGGGVGIPIMSLRPKGDVVKKVNGRSSGSVNWAEDFDSRAGRVSQGGTRRAALMLVQYCWHPDVLDFINAKRKEGAFSTSNLSVAITQDFLDAVQDDGEVRAVRRRVGWRYRIVEGEWPSGTCVANNPGTRFVEPHHRKCTPVRRARLAFYRPYQQRIEL